MNDAKYRSVWPRQLALVLFAACILFYNLIPFSLAPSALPLPNILFCIICALIIRHPKIVPFWLIGLIYFSFDIFLAKPFGIWTACVLISSEVLRANRDAFLENLFPFEWFYFAMVFLLALVINLIVLTIAFVPSPPISNIAWEFVFTVSSYPVVIFIITHILRLRKPVLGAFGVKGRKI